MHVWMGLGLAADSKPGRLPFAELVPAHISTQIPVDRSCRHKKRGVKSICLQTRQGFLIDRQIGVVDRDCHGAIGKRFARLQAGHNVFKRQDAVSAAGKNLEMFFELRDRDVGAGIIGFAEPMVHQDCCVIGRLCGMRCQTGESGGDNQGKNNMFEAISCSHRTASTKLKRGEHTAPSIAGPVSVWLICMASVKAAVVRCRQQGEKDRPKA